MKRKDLSLRESAMIQDALSRRHAHFMKEGEFFEVEGFRSATEVYYKMTYRNADDSLFYPMEVKADPRELGLEPEAAEELLLDFQDYYFGRYLREDRDVFLPIDWHPVDFDEYTILTKGQIFNRKLEKMADELMAQQGKELEA